MCFSLTALVPSSCVRSQPTGATRVEKGCCEPNDSALVHSSGRATPQKLARPVTSVHKRHCYIVRVQAFCIEITGLFQESTQPGNVSTRRLEARLWRALPFISAWTKQTSR